MKRDKNRASRVNWLAAATIFSWLVGQPAQAALNDTGMTGIANAEEYGMHVNTEGYPAQDAQYGRDAAARMGRLKKTGGGSKGFDFTKLDATGKPLPAGAKKWSCVRDNVTGLIWEVKTVDGGLRDMRNRYSWYNPDPATNGGDPGVRNAGQCSGGIDCDTYAYTKAVNASKLCGYSDWRLPERLELRSLVDFGKSVDVKTQYMQQFQDNDNRMSTIDADYFPHTPSRWYWTANPHADEPLWAWRIFFFDGGDGMGVKEGGRVNGTWVYVRLVRGGQ